MKRLEGKVAIITGAAKGMGATHARTFVEEGAKVVIGDVDEEKGSALAEELGENAKFVKLDVSNADDWANVVQETEDAFGPVNVLVNNAGVGIYKPIDELTEKDFEITYKVDQLGVFLGMKAVIDTMKEQGSGSIINISSVSGLRGVPTGVAYNAAKFAVTGMTKGAAADLGEYGIRVNSVHPGTIKTDLSAQDDVAEYVDSLVENVPLKRVGEVEEVSQLVLFLASEDSSYSTGAEFVVDGGMTAEL